MLIYFLFSFAFRFSSQLFVRPPQTAILLFCISFPWGWSWSLPPVQCHKLPSIVLQALFLSDLIPWIYLSVSLYNHKGFDSGYTWMTQWFSLLSSIKSEFDNKELMIRAPVSSQSCFCQLCRTSLSLAAKNIINLILILTIWWCPCVESSLVLLEEHVRKMQLISIKKGLVLKVVLELNSHHIL